MAEMQFSTGLGIESHLADAISAGTIKPGALCITTDTKKLIFVDENKQMQSLGSGIGYQVLSTDGGGGVSG